MANYKGDNTGAFGNKFITIKLKNPKEYVITKAQPVVNGGCPYIEPVVNPEFPLVVNFTSEQTEKLRSTNVCNLVVWDEQDREKQCDGVLEFDFRNGVICNVRQRRSCC